MCDERDSQLSNGWLRKVGVLGFQVFEIFILACPISSGFLEGLCVMREIASQVMAGLERWVSKIFRTTKVRRPQSNGFIERLHRTLLDEHFRIKGRTTWYESVEQMQTDLDSYLEHYNTQRPHQGRMMEGQTPYSMFKKGLKLIPKEVRSKVA